MAPRTRLLLLPLGWMLFAQVSAGQTPRPAPPPAEREQRLQIPPDILKRARPGGLVDAHQMMELRRRLAELDRLLALGSLGAAQTLLLDLEQHSSLARELVSRRIRLAQLGGDHAAAVDLVRGALQEQGRVPALWRELGVSLLATGAVDSARVAFDRFLALNPDRRSAAVVVLESYLGAGVHAPAVELIDALRNELQEPEFLGRQRATALLALGRQTEAAQEISGELRRNPYNYALVRTELLDGPYRPGEHAEFLTELTARARSAQAMGGEAMLAASLLVSEGRVAEALALAEGLYRQPNLVLVLLQSCQTLTRELPLLAATKPEQVQPSVEFLLAVLERLSGPQTTDPGLRRRVADNLADACESALVLEALGPDPQSSVARFGRLLDIVRSINPGSERLYSSQIRLAAYSKDRLGDPAGAARRLEGLLMNLDLPTEGVALVRLTLGECYLAAGDTARGRVVLTRLGRDPEFREAGGHAHYHLARLDLAEGHFATARDRFAVIALDNPGAAYANDALDLGLIISEEMENPGGGPDILALYAPTVYYDLTAQPAARLAALAEFVVAAGARLDLSEPQHLYEKARFDLAGLYAAEGQTSAALALLKQLVLDHPAGRYPARALQMQGELLLEGGQGEAARSAWQQLLAQYPDYIFADDVRDRLRTLPN